VSRLAVQQLLAGPLYSRASYALAGAALEGCRLHGFLWHKGTSAVLRSPALGGLDENTS
jgi:hypothetical protein